MLLRILAGTAAMALALVAVPAAADAANWFAQPGWQVSRPTSDRPWRVPRWAGHRHGRHVRAHQARPARASQGIYLDGIVAPLAAKAREIMAACPGAHLVSGVRHTLIAGTRRVSLHASGKAVDITGPNYGCVYAYLQGWPGGYSTDPGAVRHVHVSLDVSGHREMGLRFAHGGQSSRGHGRRYARNHRGRHRHAVG